jgi:hypothetical protein
MKSSYAGQKEIIIHCVRVMVDIHIEFSGKYSGVTCLQFCILMMGLIIRIATGGSWTNPGILPLNHYLGQY